MSTTLYLVRHGATASNTARPYRLQGRATDLPLGEEGIAQARAAAGALSDLPITAVYASPLVRAIATARLIAEPHGLEPTAVTELIEAELGRWEGLTWDEAEARDPDHFRRFMADPGTVPYPEGESFADAQARALPALARIAAAHEGRVVVVGHNVVGRSALAGLLGLPIERARGMRLANGGISAVEYPPPGQGSPVVVSLNETLHLVRAGLA